MTPRVTIGIDVGGTDIKCGVVSRQLHIVARGTVATEAGHGPDHVINLIVDVILKFAEGRDVAGAAIGVPGPLSPSRGVVIQPGNLPGWVNVALRDRVAEATNLPVVMDNDANLAAYGEFRAGGADATDLVLLTLGTGVGSGAVLDGRILHGHFENASEWGHAIVVPEGRPCHCGQRGCLEQYASAGNVAKRVVEEIEKGGESLLKEHLMAGRTVTAMDVLEASRQGDALAGRVWDEACYYLAVACVNIQHALNPGRILLGGGMSGAGEYLLARVRSHFDRLFWKQHDDAPEIALARLGNDAGVIGAGALAWECAK